MNVLGSHVSGSSHTLPMQPREDANMTDAERIPRLICPGLRPNWGTS